MSDAITGPLFDSEARILSLLGHIDVPHIDLLIDQLLRLDAESKDEVTIFVSCQGGNLVDGLKLIDTLRLLRSPVTAIGLGLVEGAGVLFLASASQRILFPGALISTAGLWDIPALHPRARTGMGLHHHPSLGEQMQIRLVEQTRETIMRIKPSLNPELLDPLASPRLLLASECLTFALADAILDGPQRLLRKHPIKKLSHGFSRLSR